MLKIQSIGSNTSIWAHENTVLTESPLEDEMWLPKRQRSENGHNHNWSPEIQMYHFHFQTNRNAEAKGKKWKNECVKKNLEKKKGKRTI